MMNLPTIDLSTVLFLFYFIAFLLGSRGLTTHLRDGASHHAAATSELREGLSAASMNDTL